MTNSADSAFPVTLVRDHDGTPTHPGAFTGDACGLTKREHFAALICAALQGNSSKSYDWEGAAGDAVKQADALIVALNAPSPNPAPSTELLRECVHDWQPTGNGQENRCAKCGDTIPF